METFGTLQSIVKHGLKQHFDYDKVTISRDGKIKTRFAGFPWNEYHLADFCTVERKDFSGVHLYHRGRIIFTFGGDQVKRYLDSTK